MFVHRISGLNAKLNPIVKAHKELTTPEPDAKKKRM
jgi:hypothetical protein